MAKASKFKNIRTVIDGISFPSKAEGAYYCMLKLRERAGEVSNVEMQKPYALTVNGFLVCTYRADFVFDDLHEKRHRCVDVKGMQTPEFKIKKKLMWAVHGIDVELAK